MKNTGKRQLKRGRILEGIVYGENILYDGQEFFREGHDL
jgi:hypothetical protein